MSLGSTLMPPPKRKSPGRPKTSAGAEDRVSIISVKGSPEYEAWFEAFSRHTHIAKVKLVRLGLAKMAEEHDFEPPPEI